MAKNPLFELYEAGTSVWLDYIRRSLMTSGELKRMIEEDAVVGMTSNPTIFEKAIGGSSDYDDALRDLVHAGAPDEEIMLSLIVEDIKLAADVLKPVYEQTKHKDGYVSIEVLPRVADDTQGTIAMAHDLFDRVGRPNIFIKIPATDAGLPAIEQCIADGLNINITLMFSVKVYEDVARAFIRGLQRRLKQRQTIDVASVASFFVSRRGTPVDQLLPQGNGAAIGLDRDKVTNVLEVDGVKLFDDSITKLLEEIDHKKKELIGGSVGAHEAQLGAIDSAVNKRLEQLEQAAVVRRIAEKEAALWKSNGSSETEIRERLGWLQVADRMEERVPELDALRKELVGEGFTDAILMGMGGSSLAPEVFRQTFGAPNGALDVHVLDTTDPAAIAALEQAIDLRKTIFIVASKSGTTLETLSHYRYFFKQAGETARQFIAITDPGTPLADEGSQRGFRRTYLNPPDIGGRYSALSYFGLVPAALGGVDIAGLLDRAATMVQACSPSVPAAENPGAWLGAVFAEAAKVGPDQVTNGAPPRIPDFS